MKSEKQFYITWFDLPSVDGQQYALFEDPALAIDCLNIAKRAGSISQNISEITIAKDKRQFITALDEIIGKENE